MIVCSSCGVHYDSCHTESIKVERDFYDDDLYYHDEWKCAVCGEFNRE